MKNLLRSVALLIGLALFCTLNSSASQVTSLSKTELSSFVATPINVQAVVSPAFEANALFANFIYLEKVVNLSAPLNYKQVPWQTNLANTIKLNSGYSGALKAILQTHRKQ